MYEQTLKLLKSVLRILVKSVFTESPISTMNRIKTHFRNSVTNKKMITIDYVVH